MEEQRILGQYEYLISVKLSGRPFSDVEQALYDECRTLANRVSEARRGRWKAWQAANPRLHVPRATFEALKQYGSRHGLRPAEAIRRLLTRAAFTVSGAPQSDGEGGAA